MSTLPPGTCGHAVPAFGCETCIGRDKQNVLLAAVGTTQAPLCPECDGMMKFTDKNAEAMELYFNCTVYQCDGEAVVKVTR